MKQLEPVAWKLEKGNDTLTTHHKELADKFRIEGGPVRITDLYAIPPGYVVVPEEPTEDMLIAGQEAWVVCKTNRSAVEDCEHSAAVWKAMIAAAKGE